MAKTVVEKQIIVPFVDMGQRQFLNVLLTGLAVGVITWLLQLVLSKYVFGPIMCHNGSEAACSSVTNYANISAGFLGAAAGLVTLVRLRIYRPLLVAIAALIGLWGLYVITDGMTWLAALSLYAVLTAAVYGLFTWLARIRSFLICLVCIIVSLLLIRLALG